MPTNSSSAPMGSWMGSGLAPRLEMTWRRAGAGGGSGGQAGERGGEQGSRVRGAAAAAGSAGTSRQQWKACSRSARAASAATAAKTRREERATGGRAQQPPAAAAGAAHHVAGAVEVGAHAVHLVDKADARHAVLVGLAPHGLRLRLHARHRVEHGDGAVQHAQRALHLAGTDQGQGRLQVRRRSGCWRDVAAQRVQRRRHAGRACQPRDQQHEPAAGAGQPVAGAGRAVRCGEAGGRTSSVKSTWPGVSMTLMRWSFHAHVVAAEVMVMPRSCGPAKPRRQMVCQAGQVVLRARRSKETWLAGREQRRAGRRSGASAGAAFRQPICHSAGRAHLLLLHPVHGGGALVHLADLVGLACGQAGGGRQQQGERCVVRGRGRARARGGYRRLGSQDLQAAAHVAHTAPCFLVGALHPSSTAPALTATRRQHPRPPSTHRCRTGCAQRSWSCPRQCAP